MTDISEEIKQPVFESPQHKAMVNLLYTNNRIMEQLNEFFRRHDITNQQFNVLRILRGRHPVPCNVKCIRDVMIFKAPDLTRLIDRLVQKGLAKRRTCSQNRRELDINITEKGCRLLERIDPEGNKLTKKLMNLTDREAKQLSDLLDKLRG